MRRAVELAKSDLLTSMVYELPELQGVMGGVYAEKEGEHPDVVQAIGAQYQEVTHETGEVTKAFGVTGPCEYSRFGLFQAKLKVSGSSDPYGLRRACVQILLLCLRSDALIDLRWLFSQIVDAEQVPKLETFMRERFMQKMAEGASEKKKKYCQGIVV